MPRLSVPHRAALVLLTLSLAGIALSVPARPASADDVLTGAISGHVLPRARSTWGADVPQVRAYRQNGSSWVPVDPATQTGADGGYTVSGLQPGTYRVLFEHTTKFTTYFTSWYGGDDLASAEDVTVLPAAEASGVDGSLDTESRVSGRVTDARGRPIAGVKVAAEQLGRLTTDTAQGLGSTSPAVTDALGRYTIGGAVDAAYRLRFTPTDEWHVPRFWPSARISRPDRAVDLVTTLNHDVSGIDIVLPDAGVVTGALDTQIPSSRPIRPVAYGRRAGAWVELARGSHTSDSYRIGGVEPGQVRICLRDRFSCVGGPDPGSATPIQVMARGTERAPARLPDFGALAGSVQGESSASPAARVVVHRTTDSGFEEVASVTTAPDGTYVVEDLPPDRYLVQFLALAPDDGSVETATTQEFWPDADSLDEAAPVTVRPGRTTPGVDAVIDRGATFSGTLVDDGDGITATPDAFRRNLDGTWTEVPTHALSAGKTTPAGTPYTVGGLRPGTYRFAIGTHRAILAAGVAETWVPDSPTRAGAQSFSVPDLDSSVTGVDVDADLGAAIGGTALHLGSWLTTSGQAIAYRKVGAGWVEDGRMKPVMLTQSRIVLTGLQGGTYRLGFVPSNGLDATGYAGRGFPTDIEHAADIGVVRGQSVDDVEVDLRPTVRVAVPARILGSPRVGRTLRLDPGLWSPTGTRLSFAWLVDGRRVPGAVSRTYQVRRQDRGARISVRILGRRTGPWLPHVEITPATARVR